MHICRVWALIDAPQLDQSVILIDLTALISLTTLAALTARELQKRCCVLTRWHPAGPGCPEALCGPSPVSCFMTYVIRNVQ